MIVDVKEAKVIRRATFKSDINKQGKGKVQKANNHPAGRRSKRNTLCAGNEQRSPTFRYKGGGGSSVFFFLNFFNLIFCCFLSLISNFICLNSAK